MSTAAYHAARMVALHSALLSLLTEFAEDATADTVHASFTLKNPADPEDFSALDLHYTSRGVPVGGEGM